MVKKILIGLGFFGGIVGLIIIFLFIFPQNLYLLYFYSPFHSFDFSNTAATPVRRKITKPPPNFSYKGMYSAGNLQFQSPWDITETFRKDEYIAYDAVGSKLITTYLSSELNLFEVTRSKNDGTLEDLEKIAGHKITKNYDYYSFLLNRSIKQVHPFGDRNKNWAEATYVIVKAAIPLNKKVDRIDEIWHNGFRIFDIKGDLDL